MKQGISLTEMAAKIEADKARKQDLLVDTRELTVLTSPKGGTTLTLPNDSDLHVSPLAHRQIGQRLGLRADLLDRLQVDYPGEHAGLLNSLLHEDPLTKPKKGFKPGQYLLRSFTDGGPNGEGVARAFLSNVYRPIDHDQIAEAALPVIMGLQNAGHQVQIDSCEVTDQRLYIKVVIPTVSYDLKDFIDPRRHEFLPNGGDVVQAGFVVKNSEVGLGGFDVEQLVYRLVCRNGLITASLLKKRHVGRKLEAGEDMSIYKSDTLAADDRALMLKLRDTITAAVDDTKFRVIVQEFAAAAESKPLEKPIKAMEILAPRVGLTDGESQSVLEHLLKGGDLSKFGVVNAVTAAAQDVDSYDRSVEMETLAADDVMRMPVKDWEAIAATA